MVRVSLATVDVCLATYDGLLPVYVNMWLDLQKTLPVSFKHGDMSFGNSAVGNLTIGDGKKVAVQKVRHENKVTGFRWVQRRLFSRSATSRVTFYFEMGGP